MNFTKYKNLFLVVLSLVLIYGLGSTLMPLFIAFSLAYLFFPLIRNLETRGLSRSIAVFGVFSLIALLLVGLTLVVVPKLYADASDLLKEWPTLLAKIFTWMETVSAAIGYPLQLNDMAKTDWLNSLISSMSIGSIKGLSAGLGGLFANAFGGIVAFLNICLIPLFFFYLINDYESIIHKLRSHIPPSQISLVDYYLSKINEILSGYIRGQLLVALILAGLYGVGLSLVGLKFGFLVGVLTGVLGIIPYVGFSFGFFLSMTLALVHFSGTTLFLSVAAVFLVVQTLESFIITPRLVGNKVGLNELTTILALIIGGNLFGLLGMLLAIPAAAILKLFIKI